MRKVLHNLSELHWTGREVGAGETTAMIKSEDSAKYDLLTTLGLID